MTMTKDQFLQQQGEIWDRMNPQAEPPQKTLGQSWAENIIFSSNGMLSFNVKGGSYVTYSIGSLVVDREKLNKIRQIIAEWIDAIVFGSLSNRESEALKSIAEAAIAVLAKGEKK